MFKYNPIFLNMRSFSISELSRYTGVKAHTIRIWEQRYNALQPERSDGNTRYYSGEQLRRLLNIVSLIDRGHKISELGRLSDSALFEAVSKFIEQEDFPENSPEYFITQMVSAGMTMDEVYFEKLFATCVVRFGLKQTYIQIIHPLLVRIGLMWSADAMPPSNEHFISNLIRQKLFSAIDALPPPKNSTDSWLLFLKEDEFHELGLLLANYLIRQASRPVIYLGPNVPFIALTETIHQVNPKNLLFFVVRKENPEDLQRYIEELSGIFSGSHIYFAADAELAGSLTFPAECSWLSSADQLTHILDR